MKTVFCISGEYIQLPLQLEEILQDVLQLADLANENDQVVSINHQYKQIFGHTFTDSNCSFSILRN